MTDWISTKDRLPNQRQQVIIRKGDEYVGIAIFMEKVVLPTSDMENMFYYSNGYWNINEITDWMPLP